MRTALFTAWVMLALSCEPGASESEGGAVGLAVAALNVATCAQLQAISTNLAGSYRLTSDIDCTGFDAGDGGGFEPLGHRDEVRFTGYFDGDGHSITGLTVARPWLTSSGLFGSTDGAVIERVAMLNANIEGVQAVGALVGIAYGTTIRESYATGVVAGWTDVGGLVGEIDPSSTVEDCYATMTIVADHDHGLLVGWVAGSIERSYAVGSAPARLGAIYDGSIAASFYDCNFTGDCSEEGASSTAVMLQQSTYTGAGWDFDETWGFLGTNHYPCLQWQDGCGCVAGTDSDGDGADDCSDGCIANPDKTSPGVCGCEQPDFDSDGDGPLDCNDPCPLDSTKLDPGICGCNEPDVDADGDGLLNCNDPDWSRAIRSCAELQAIRDDLAGNYRLVVDIDCTGFDAGDGGGFEPLGHRDAERFAGHFDGNGHVITGLRSMYPDRVSVGLFGATEGAVIERVGLVNASVSGVQAVGPLIGIAIDTTVRQAYAAGGLVAGAADAGGLVGELDPNSTMQDCYATTGVAGDNASGLLVGWVDGSIERSYSAGAAPPRLGAIYGGSIDTSFYDCDVAGDCSELGASSTAVMTTPSTYVGWDFNDVWSTGPSGYPCLQWQADCRCVPGRDYDGDGASDCADPNILGYWNFDEASGNTVLDSSALPTHGALINATRDTNGRLGGAVYFNGTTSRISIPSGGWNVGTPITYSAWYKADGRPQGVVFEHRHTSVVTGSFAFYPLHFSGSTWEHVRFGAYDSTGTGRAAAFRGITPPGKWAMVTVVIKPDEMRVFKNGVPLGSTTIVGGLPPIPGPLFIGARGEVPDSFFKGWIDELAVYGRAMSDTEVANLYQQYGETPAVPWAETGGLVGQWSFDEGNGTTTADSTGLGNTGTLQGGTTWDPNGVAGSCLRFNGTNARVRVLDGLWNQATPGTFVLWYKRDTAPTGNFLMEHMLGSSNAGAFTLRADAPGYVAYETTQISRSGTGWTAPAIGVWRMLAVTTTPTELKLYRDGTLVGTTPMNGGPPYIPGDLYFGARGVENDNYFKGWIDEVSIYARALSGAEIGDLYRDTLSSAYQVCEDDDDCPTGLVCGFGIGPMFGYPEDAGVCWNPAACPPGGTQCGTPNALCGLECCVPNCGAPGTPNSCGRECLPCVEGADSDGDGLLDCEERTDNYPETNPLVPNAVACGDGLVTAGEVCDPGEYVHCTPDCSMSCDVCGIACAGTEGYEPGAPWPTDNQCPQRRGVGDIGELVLGSWVAPLGRVTAQPVVGADGTMYVGTNIAEGGNKFVAIGPDGETKWSVDTADGFVAAAAVSARGVIYAPSLDGKLYAFNAQTGAVSWTFEEAEGPMAFAPLIGDNGVIYVSSADRNLYALSDDTTSVSILWSRRLSQGAVGSVASGGPDGPLYAVTIDQELRVLELDGTQRWEGGIPVRPTAGPLVDAYGNLLVPTVAGVYPINVTTRTGGPGVPILDLSEGEFVSGVRLTPSGGFIACTQRRIVHYSNTLAFLWSVIAPPDRTVVSCPIVSGELVYHILDNGMDVLNIADGSLRQKVALPEGVDENVGPPAATIGHVFVGTGTGPTSPNPDCKPDGEGCSAPDVCVDGRCECTPDCSAVECGPDPDCGQECLNLCESTEVCIDGACCEPDCSQKSCGDDDGCGGPCGLCDLGEPCTAAGDCRNGFGCFLSPQSEYRCYPDVCPTDCATKACGDDRDDGCNGECLGLCEPFEPGCETNSDCPVGYECGHQEGPLYGEAPGTSVCRPQDICPRRCEIEGRECGTDGCGNNCGTCAEGTCVDGVCNDPTDVSALPPGFPPPLPQGGGAFAMPGVQGEVIGVVQGHAGVTPGGAATYSIPIEVPPGRGGHQPQLTLTYSSARGDGYIGRGWSLTGFPVSVISRCNRGRTMGDADNPSTWAGAVKFNADDSFCLDGALLVPVNGAYGDDGTEYRTETETFRKIVSYGGSNVSPYEGPEHFRVWTKDGQVLTYGGTDDASVLLDSELSVKRSWALSEAQDRAGSVMSVGYKQIQCTDAEPEVDDNGEPLEYCGTKELLLTRITYGAEYGGDGRQIVFVYSGKEPRPDSTYGYQNGARTSRTQLLEQIQTFAEGIHARTYQLSYVEPWENPAEAAFERRNRFSVLKTVEDCVSLDPSDESPLVCTPTTVFRYGRHSDLDEGGTASLELGPVASSTVLDFDGDGADDLFFLSDATNTVHVAFGNRGSSSSAFDVFIDTGRQALQHCKLVGSLDFDGDRLDDVAVSCRVNQGPSGTGLFIWLSDGRSGFRALIDTDIGPVSHIVDIDGDGIAEAIGDTHLWSLDLSPQCRSLVRFGSPPSWPTNSSAWPTAMGTCAFDATPHDYCENGTFIDLDGNDIPESHCPPDDDEGNLEDDDAEPKWFHFADRNGDGLMDKLVWDRNESIQDKYIGSIRVDINTGKGFIRQDLDSGVGLDEFQRAHVSDFDGDGRDDLLIQDTTASYSEDAFWKVHYGNYTEGNLDNSPAEFEAMWVGDFNGDGLADLLRDMPGTLLKVYWNPGALGGALRVVRDGFGNLTEFLYAAPEFPGEPLPSASAYTPGDDCEWPIRCARRSPSTLVREMRTYTGALPLPERYTRAFTISDGQTQVQSRVTYDYADGRFYGPQYRWLGFGSRTITQLDPSTGAVIAMQTQNYDNATAGTGPVPFLAAGKLLTTTTTAIVEGSELNGGEPITYRTVREQTWEELLSTSGRPFMYADSSTTTSEATSGELTSTYTSEEIERLVDLNGDLQRERRELVDGSYESQTWDYHPPDFTNWVFGLPERHTAISSVPDAVDDFAARHLSYEYYENGLIKDIVQEPDSLDTSLEDELYLRTTFVRDADNFFAVVATEQRDATGAQVRKSTISYAMDYVLPRTHGLWIEDERELITQVHYDSTHGQILTMIDPNGLTTQWSYDGFGQLLDEARPDGTTSVRRQEAEVFGETESIEVDPTYQVSTQTSAGVARIVQYDSAGNERRARVRGFEGAWIEEETKYDVRGRAVERSRPHLAGDTSQGIESNDYDNFDRVTSTTSASGVASRFSYAPAGLVQGVFSDMAEHESDTIALATNDELSTARATVLNARSLPRAVFDKRTPASETTLEGYARSTYSYGAFGMLESTVDPRDNQSTIRHDRLGRATEHTDASTGTRTVGYYATGEVRFQEDAMNVRSTFFYDGAGRLTRTVGPDGTTTWAYDGPAALRQQGKLTSSTSPAAPGVSAVTTNYAYDLETGMLGKVERQIESNTYAIELKYYPNGQLAELHYPSAGGQRFALRLGYDVSGALDLVSNLDSNEEYWRLDEAYQGLSPRMETLGNGLSTRTSYEDLTGHVSEIAEGSALAAGIPSTLSVIKSIAYSYYEDGSVRTRTAVESGSQAIADTYDYDLLSRLRTMTRVRGTEPARVMEDIHYDFDGRILFMGHPAPTTGPIVHVAYDYEQLPHAATKVGTDTFHYDSNGSQDLRTGPGIPGGRQSISYTAFQLPRAITTGTDPNVTTTILQYDAEQARVLKRSTSANVTSDTIYVDRLYERTTLSTASEGTATHTYRVLAGGRAVAEIERNEIAGVVDPQLETTRYVHVDRLGTPHLVTDADATVIDRPEYRAFGSKVGGGTETLSGFTGHRMDDDLALIDMGGRLYDPYIGQFISADPLRANTFDTQGLNRYSYTRNNPIKRIDPDGFQDCDLPSCPDDGDDDNDEGSEEGGLDLCESMPGHCPGSCPLGEIDDGMGGCMEPQLPDPCPKGQKLNDLGMCEKIVRTSGQGNKASGPPASEPVPPPRAHDRATKEPLSGRNIAGGTEPTPDIMTLGLFHPFVGTDVNEALRGYAEFEMRKHQIQELPWNILSFYAGHGIGRFIFKPLGVALSRPMRLAWGRVFQRSGGDMAHFISQGETYARAFHLAQRYEGMGHHFLARRWSWIPTWISESPLFLLKPPGMSRGRFYELHYLADPRFFGARMPKGYGGGWSGRAAGLQKPGLMGQLWYGSPRPLKLTLGAGTLSLWLFDDDD